MEKVNAIILAGGKGTRLRPLTQNTPKPMLEVANKPVLDRVIEWLNGYNIDEITITLGYKSEVIENHAQKLKGKINLIVEQTPLGTAGAVKNAQKFLSQTFIVASGDALNDIDLTAMLKSHYKSGKLVTLAVTNVENPSLYGVVNFDHDGTVKGFVEKPKTDIYGKSVNTGIYIINKSALDLIPPKTSYDFARDLFPRLVEEKQLNAYVHSGYWCDIGDKQSYHKACYHYKRIESKGVDLVDKTAKIDGKIQNCIVGKNCVIAEKSVLKNCVLLDGVTVYGIHENEIIGSGYAVSVNA